MKNIVTIAFCFYCLLCQAKDPPLMNIRLMYEQAAINDVSCKRLINLLHQPNNPLLLGYKGGATMMMAQHVPNPFTKLSYFKSGKEMLHHAIEADKMNLELRFLRFAAQSKAPAFLGYRNKIAEDKTFLMDYLSLERDPFLKKLILAFLSNSEFLTDKEKSALINIKISHGQ